jgi:hypothetical protein
MLFFRLYMGIQPRNHSLAWQSKTLWIFRRRHNLIVPIVQNDKDARPEHTQPIRILGICRKAARRRSPGEIQVILCFGEALAMYRLL